MELGNADEYLEQLKLRLEEKHFVHVPGEQYSSLLRHFGATEDDLHTLESGVVHQRLPPDPEPAMSFRLTASHRVLLKAWLHEDQVRTPSKCHQIGKSSTGNPATSSTIVPKELGRRPSKISFANCHSVVQISSKEICSDSGAKVYFERSATRKINMTSADYSKSSIPVAMAKINDFLQPLVHHEQANLNAQSPITINDQILGRINRDPYKGNEEDAAEPTPEGIHQDGTEISSITLIGRSNVKRGEGAESRIWALQQPTGNYSSDRYGELKATTVGDGFNWDNCLFNKALESPWETIIFNDREVKHEARKFLREPGTEGRPCYRDVIVSFVRKPCRDGSDEEEVVIGYEDGVEIRRRSSIV